MTGLLLMYLFGPYHPEIRWTSSQELIHKQPIMADLLQNDSVIA